MSSTLIKKVRKVVREWPCRFPGCGRVFSFGRECDDTNQPTDVEPDDASPVVSQASAMADAHQSVVIISSVASTTSVVPDVTGPSSFIPAHFRRTCHRSISRTVFLSVTTCITTV